MSAEKEITLSQSAINKKAVQLLIFIHADKDFIDKFSEDSGYCSGLSSLWLYSKWLQAQPPSYFLLEDQKQQDPQTPKEPLKLVSSDNYVWFKSIVELIINWDETKSLTSEEVTSFKRFIYLVEYFQNINDYLPVNQSSLEQFLKNTQGQTPRKEYTIASLLTLEQLKWLLKINGLLKDHRLILISSSKHATALFKNGNSYYYFDPNGDSGEEQTTSIDEIAKLIFEAHCYILDDNDSKIKLFDYTKPSPFGIRIFTFDKSDINYPSQEEILSKITFTSDFEKKVVSEYPGLVLAASMGCMESLKFFLKKGLDPNIRTKEGNTALMEASAIGEFEIVKLLLAIGADVNLQGNYGNTSLINASRGGYMQIIHELLAKGANPNIKDNIGMTAFITAAGKGRLAVIKEFLANKNTDCYTSDTLKQDALIMAAMNGYVDVVGELLAAGFDFNNTDHMGRTAFMLAAEEGRIGVIRELLARGVDFCKKDECGDTAFTLASICGHIEILEELIKRGVDPNIPGDHGRTALMAASIYDDTEAVKYLLHIKDVDVNKQDIYGETALIYAASRGRVNIVKELLSKKDIDVNKEDLQGRTALMRAANCKEVVKELLQAKDININEQDVKGRTALMYAANYGSEDVVKELLANGADPNIQDKKGRAALMLAICNSYSKEDGQLDFSKTSLINTDPEVSNEDFILALVKKHIAIVRMLIANEKTDVNIKDKNGRTALMIAARIRNVDVMKELLTSKKTDINVKGAKGKTVFDITTSETIKKLLKNR